MKKDYTVERMNNRAVMMKTVVVLGGGITGLCTMHYLQRQVKEHNLDVRLVLIEKIHI